MPRTHTNIYVYAKIREKITEIAEVEHRSESQVIECLLALGIDAHAAGTSLAGAVSKYRDGDDTDPAPKAGA